MFFMFLFCMLQQCTLFSPKHFFCPPNLPSLHLRDTKHITLQKWPPFLMALIMRSERAGVCGCERCVSSDMQSQYFTAGRVNESIWPCMRSQTLREREFLSVRFTGLTSALGTFLNVFTACLDLTLIPPHTPISPNLLTVTYNQRHSWKHFLKNRTHVLHKKEACRKEKSLMSNGFS